VEVDEVDDDVDDVVEDDVEDEAPPTDVDADEEDE
jgi:hypothetical protein